MKNNEYNYTEHITYSELGVQEVGHRDIELGWDSITRLVSYVKDMRKEFFDFIDIIDNKTGAVLATFSPKGLIYADDDFYKIFFLEYYDNLD